jgi:phage terminase large subunit-like protein
MYKIKKFDPFNFDRSKYYYDEKAALRAVNFFEKLLHHTKGEYAGKNFKLMDWQRDEIIRPLFGIKRFSDNTRKFRQCYVEVPRKNGKSTLAAGIALYMLIADGEQGAEVYSVAGDRDQARIVFKQASEMIELSPQLLEITEQYKNSILVPETRSVYRVLSAEASSAHGLNASGVVFDELHVQPDRYLYDVMKTSQGSRKEPVFFMITTAGFKKETIAGEVREYADKIREGILEDDKFLPVIYSADDFDNPDEPEIDWTDPHIWEAVNPGLGETIRRDYLETEAKRAAASPAYQNTFRRLHLNQWVGQESRWLDMRKWDNCYVQFSEEQFYGSRCFAGLDLSSTQDLTSLVLVFPSEPGEEEKYAVLPYFWVPEDSVIERSRSDGIPYDAWTRDGYIEATPGEAIDYHYVVHKIEELAEKFDIQQIAFDRWGSAMITQTLMDLGFEVVSMGQGYASMSPPTSELMRLVLSGMIQHNGNPVLRWNADNVVVRTDPAGNLKPDKKKSKEKIDGIVALIMALDRAIRHQQQKQSVYETRGIMRV